MAADQKGAVERGARLVFVDESGFSQRPSVRRTWAPKGQTPIIRHHFNWKRLHAISALVCNPDGSDPSLYLRLQPESVVSQSVIAFLEAMKQEIGGPVVLLWDGLGSHWSKLTQEHVAQESEWLTTERFPAYAPELNPVEYLWSVLKGKDTANLCAHSIDEVEQKLHQAKERLETAGDILPGFLRASGLYGECAPATPSCEGH